MEIDFLEIFQDAIEKMLYEKSKHGDSWQTCNMDDLITYLSKHVDKIKKYTDALDIINYGLFIASRLRLQ